MSVLTTSLLISDSCLEDLHAAMEFMTSYLPWRQGVSPHHPEQQYIWPCLMSCDTLSLARADQVQVSLLQCIDCYDDMLLPLVVLVLQVPIELVKNGTYALKRTCLLQTQHAKSKSTERHRQRGHWEDGSIMLPFLKVQHAPITWQLDSVLSCALAESKACICDSNSADLSIPQFLSPTILQYVYACQIVEYTSTICWSWNMPSLWQAAAKNGTRMMTAAKMTAEDPKHKPRPSEDLCKDPRRGHSHKDFKFLKAQVGLGPPG